MRTANKPRLPLTVIGGFLGAGKTTLLNRLISSSAGRRLAVLVNDFGALNIDASLVASQDGSTLALTNGCVCCQIGDDLAAALIGVLDGPDAFDAVVIEASGVSDPWRIAQIGLAEPGLALEAVIVLLDASSALAHASDPLLADTLVRQLRSADLVVVNKMDLVEAGELPRVREWLADVAAGAPVFECAYGEVPASLLTGLALDLMAQPPAGAPHPGHGCCADPAHAPGGHPLHHEHGALFESWHYRPAGALQAARLRHLLRNMPTGVLRLKGLVRTDEHPLAELQFGGRHGSLRRASGQSPAIEAIVAIGLKGRLPVAQLQAELRAADPALIQLTNDT